LAWKSGINGYQLDQIQQLNSEAGRKKMGLRGHNSMDEIQKNLSIKQFITSQFVKYYNKLLPKRLKK
jgi:hypothetical protein